MAELSSTRDGGVHSCIEIWSKRQPTVVMSLIMENKQEQSNGEQSKQSHTTDDSRILNSSEKYLYLLTDYKRCIP